MTENSFYPCLILRFTILGLGYLHKIGCEASLIVCITNIPSFLFVRYNPYIETDCKACGLHEQLHLHRAEIFLSA